MINTAKILANLNRLLFFIRFKIAYQFKKSKSWMVGEIIQERKTNPEKESSQTHSIFDKSNLQQPWDCKDDH